ncbi:MAG TPA: hypothetical protein VK476_00610, partial [Flavobacterium sp.]|nr:hypothetical protein [Flavobacterium sp.]
LIAPKCDETIVAGNMPQNVIFTWLPAPGVAPGTQYKLKIVELVPITRNPNEAMNSATTPAFFETTVNTYSFFYGPAQPAFKDGKKYAWRVTALKPGTVNSNFQNNGNSEVCNFLYQKPIATAQSNTASYGINLLKPIKGAHINSGYGLEFSWTASGKPLKNYELQFTDSYRQEEKIKNWSSLPENLFSTHNAFMASKNVGKKLSENLPGSWTNGKGKIAWRIIARDNNEKAIDSSKIEIYEIVDAPLAERIKLVSPIQGKKIVSGYGLKYQWESSKKLSITKYQLQFTDRISNDQKITDWNNIPEKLFSNKNASFASKDTQELSVEFSNTLSNGTGKIAWRVVGYSYGFPVDSSKIETFELIEDTSEIAQLKGFMMNGYYVQITSIDNKDQDKFGGAGLMYLWENGKQVKVYFSNLKVRPFAFIAKTQKKLWAAIQGEVNIDIYNQLYGLSKFNLAASAAADGTFQLALNKMKITANIEGAMENDLFKITKDGSHAEGMVKGKWFTNFFIPTGANTSNNLYEFESDEASMKMTFADKFDGSVNLKADKKMEGLANGKIAVTFGEMPGDMELKVKGLQGDLNLSGTVMVDKARPTNTSIVTTFATLSLPFKNQKNLNFPLTLEKPLSWKLNKDGSVLANITEMYVHLSSAGTLDDKFKNYPKGLNFDKFGAKIIMPSKSGTQNAGTMDINFSNIYNKGKGYGTLLKNEFTTKSEVHISGFSSKLDKTELLMNNNSLIYLNITGKIYVPFINEWAP